MEALKASELRIGNWIKSIGGTMLPITPDLIPLIAKGTCIAIGIELTPEILEKCGFSEQTEKGYFITNYPELYAVRKETDGYFFVDGDGVSVYQPMQYLHQLQNQYWIIEAKELLFNPNK